MKSNPLVSVIVPCYNQGIYLDECIESIEKQTYDNIEVIVINDGSTDLTTINVLEKIKRNKKNIRIIDIDNSGVSKARNVGVKSSHGSYILPLDGDDKIHKFYIEKCVKILNGRNDIDVVYCISKFFGAKKGLYPLKKFSVETMLKYNVIICTAMFKRKDFDLINGYNENMVHGLEDWDFWLSFVEENKKFYRIDEVLFYYRIKKVSRNKQLETDREKNRTMFEQIYYNHENLYRKYNLNFNFSTTHNNSKINDVYLLIKSNIAIFINKTNLIISIFKNKF